MESSEKIVVLDLSNRGKIEVKGEDAQEFLQNISSNDVRVSPGKSVKSAFLDKFGKLIGIICIHKPKDQYGFILDADVLATPKIVDYLQSQAKLTKSSIENITYKQGIIHISGSKADYLLDELEAKVDMKELIVSRNDRFSKTGDVVHGFDIFLPVLKIRNVFESIMSSPFKPVFIKPEEYEPLRVLKGIPEFGKDYDEEYTIMEVGTDDCVSYNKGCFVGQEVVARMKAYNGEIPQKIVKLKSEKKIEKGSKLYKITDKRNDAGKITSMVDFKGEYFYLATVKKPFYTKGEQVEDTMGKKLTVL